MTLEWLWVFNSRLFGLGNPLGLGKLLQAWSACGTSMARDPLLL